MISGLCDATFACLALSLAAASPTIALALFSPGRPAHILEFPVSYDDTQVALLKSAREAEISRDPRATLLISFTWKEARVARRAPSGAPAYTCVTRDENAYAESA